MGLQRFHALLVARNREFLRDRIALSWNIVLPVLIVIGFAFAFTSDDKTLFKVGLLGLEEAARAEEDFPDFWFLSYTTGVIHWSRRDETRTRHYLGRAVELTGGDLPFMLSINAAACFTFGDDDAVNGQNHNG